MSDARAVTAILLAAALPVAALCFTAAPAAAELCSVDQAPGATVLLPYFEVDLGDPSGMTTLFELANAGPAPVLVRVTLWTDLAVPTWAFDVYLTGFDVQSFNLRDLFAGRPPVTGSEVTPDGRFSLPSAPLPGCDGAIEPETPVAHLRAAHRGLPSPQFGGLCSALRHPDALARGYLTADVVGECGSDLFPSDPGYFGSDGIARPDNVLWGDYFYVDPENNFAQSDSLVRLEADPEAFGAGDRTFYGRYVGFDGSDGREPLPSAWALRSLAVGPDADYDIVAWREVPAPALPFPCGEFPPESLPPVERILVIDEQENFFDPRSLPVSPPVMLFAPAASRQDGWFAHAAGWWYADLDRSIIDPAQGYVTALFGAENRYSIAVGGTPMGPGCGPQGCDLGFEAPATRLCIFGQNEGDTTLDPGQRVLVQVTAGGCHSSSCLGLEQWACAVREAADGAFEVDSRFCLVNHGQACLPACDYKPTAVCRTGPLEPGVYTVRGAGQEIAFTVPSTVPDGGLCAGEAGP